MNKQLLQDALGWGFGLWLIGYILGVALFPFVPTAYLGWIIMPIGAGLTVWVLIRRVTSRSFQHYVLVAVAWTLIAIVCDYAFLVLLFNPQDGYYKLDVFIYYALTLLFPLLVGWRKGRMSGADLHK